MNKIEKLGHTFRNPAYVEKDGVFNADWKETTLTFPFSVIIDKINEIIDFLEALSDKEEICPIVGMKCHCGLPQKEESKDQPSKPSIRDEIRGIVLDNHGDPVKTTDQILDLVKKHLVEEVEILEPAKYVKMHDECLDGYTFAKEDIIKIIKQLN